MNITISMGLHATEPGMEVQTTVTQFPPGGYNGSKGFVLLTFLVQNGNMALFLPDLEAARAFLARAQTAVDVAAGQVQPEPASVLEGTLPFAPPALDSLHNEAIVEDEIRDSIGEPSLGDA